MPTRAERVTSQDDRQQSWPILAAVVAAGAVLRLLPVLRADFPLNDGGLFLAMANEIESAGFALPMTSGYNDLAIPFAYPPLGLYLTAALQALGIHGLDVLRWLPLILTIAMIPVVYLIGREVFDTERMALAAAAFFAVSTRSYDWMIQGGGVTRAPGFLLALLAILFAIRAYRERNSGSVLWAGIALGATGLAHPLAAIFALVSVALVLPLLAADRRMALRRLVLVLSTAAVLVMPWFLLVVSRHGTEPFLAAAASGADPLSGLRGLTVSRTSGGYLEILGLATTLALIISALRGFWLAPVWALAILMVDGRAGQTYMTVPAALALSFMVRDLGSIVGLRWRPLRRRARAAIAVTLVLAASADSLAAQAQPSSPLRALSEPTRAAMAWVAEESEPGASFVVVSGRYWAQDAEAEWFPVLASRRNVATVQGYEWLSPGAFARQIDRAMRLPECVARDDLPCIESWFEGAGRVDYLFLTNSDVAAAAGIECCLQLAEQIASFREAEVIRESPEMRVVRLGQLVVDP